MNSRSSGLALIIVIMILTVLMVMATPFAVSMVYKEKIGRNTFHRSQTDVAATGARNHAISLLYRTHDFFENSDECQPPFNTPDYDTRAELAVDFKTNGLDTIISLSNPKGKIWDVKVQDEQGKINITSAPVRVFSNLTKLYGTMPGVMLADVLTEYSGRTADWVDPRNLRGYSEVTLLDGNRVHLVRVDSGSFISSFNEVRLSFGNEVFYARIIPRQPCRQCQRTFPVLLKDHALHNKVSVIKSIRRSDSWYLGGRMLFLDRLVPERFLTPYTIVTVSPRHPININTAPREVLMANLVGVGNRRLFGPQGRQRDGDDRISQTVAKGLVTALQSVEIKGPADYKKFLEDSGLLSDTQINNLLRNGMVPFVDYIDEKYTDTVPFCFKSHNKYTVLATGITNYSSANQAARSTFREVVDVAPPELLEWRLESQYDYDREFAVPHGNPARLITFPALTKLGPTAIFHSQPDHSRHPGKGELKLSTMADRRGRNIVLTEHFPETHEGQTLVGQPLTYEQGKIFTFQDDLDVNPGGFEAWVKMSTVNDGLYFMDIKQGEFQNRLSLQYTGGELVLSACDATVETKAAQIRAPMNFDADTWYHLGAYWKGTKYAQLALMVDGKSVGTFAHYDENDQMILTELSADLADQIDVIDQDTDGLVVPANSTAGFPSQGVIEIGEEAIEYDEITDEGFQVVAIWNPVISPAQYTYVGRGARGTVVKDHPIGAKVTVYGYSNTLKDQISLSGYPSLDVSTLHTGGAILRGNMTDTMPRTTIFRPL
ncbi:MAG: hypothetical protein KAI63_06355, partial [Planctomycetes bacterium]|nr:hypothetical protein [Planctomycetota bacterium]